MLFSLPSCSVSKRLNGKKLLTGNKIDILTDDKSIDKTRLKADLATLVGQKPNENLLGIPRERLGDKPVGHDNVATQAAVINMQNYLRNKKGYYNAEVTVDSIVKKNKVEVNYKVTPKALFKVGSIQFYGKDTSLINKINTLRGNDALLKPGDPVDAGQFDRELSRITLALQNQGYANFAKNYFRIKGDSTKTTKTVDVFFEVLSPLPDSTHTRYSIGDISIYTDNQQQQNQADLVDTVYDKKNFYRQSTDFIVKPSIINNQIFLEKGSLFSRENRDKTNRKLSGLGTYKFVSLEPTISPTSDSLIDYNIRLTPYDHSWIADFGTELFYSTINQGSNELIGVSLSSQFQNRNFLGGAEQFTIGAESGVELQIPDFKINTVNVNINSNLEIPRQVDIFRVSRLLENLSILSPSESQRFKEETTTNIGAGLSYINTSNLFTIRSVSTSFSYDYRRTNNTRFLITPLGVDLNLYTLKDQFLDQQRDNLLLINTFEDNLITGFLLKSVSFIRSKPANTRGIGSTTIINGEVSGWEKFLVNNMYNFIAGKDENLTLGDVEFAEYFRLEVDQRWYKSFNNKTSFAWRGYVGFILPFGYDAEAPYVRQFNVGGPNSIRAWDQRELGPGGYAGLLEKPIANQTFYQQGDVKLEFNVEYRFPLFWLIEGALFVDAGNVWTLKADQKRPKSNITSSFYNQMAIGAGYGIRFDFDYFNIRFDFGYKLRNPYHERDIGEVVQPVFSYEDYSGHWYTWKGIKKQRFGNFQVAVNYPF